MNQIVYYFYSCSFTLLTWYPNDQAIFLSLTRKHFFTMPLTQKQEKLIVEVTRFIDSSPLERTPVIELVQRSGLTEKLLTKGFKSVFKETLYNYQLRLCMEEAAILLHKGKSIKEVSIACGYKTQGNFTRAFFKIKKVTPSQYQSEKISQ